MATEFCGTIAHIVQTGNVFAIGGKTIDGASRLDINLKSGKHEDATIALHISVRFDDDIIIRNSYLGNGKWSQEEREEYIHDYSLNNPLIAGDDFQFYIFIGETYFHIAINKTPYCTYAYKMPIEKIRTIEVTKDLQHITQIDHRSVYPYAHPPVQFDDYEVAFSNDVPRHFQPGHVIIITGIPSGNSKGRFTIVFTEGETKREALHFNVRFHPEYQIIRNSMNENYQFGAEERSGNFPFAINEQFKLAIAMTTTDFLFAINGRFFGSFKYRNYDVFEKMNGFKIYTKLGLQLEITSVDHVIMTIMNCREFETYSRPEVEIM